LRAKEGGSGSQLRLLEALTGKGQNQAALQNQQFQNELARYQALLNQMMLQYRG